MSAHIKFTSGTAGSAAVGIVGTGLAMALPEQKWIGIVLMAIGVAVFIFDVKIENGNIRLGNPKGAHVSYWGPWVLIIGGPLVGLLWLFLWPPLHATSITDKARPFSWTWEPLTLEESKNLSEVMKGHGTQTIQIVCTSESCSALANSLSEIFTTLQWRIENNYGVIREYSRGLTGIAISRDDNIALALKNALEGNTNLKIGFRLPNSIPNRLSQNDYLVVAIGGKEPPVPLPDYVQKEMASLGMTLKQLSTEMSTFAVDRQREQSRLPDVEAQQDPGQRMRVRWDRDRAFTDETTTLLRSKFGVRVTQATVELNKFSIQTPFMVQTSNSPTLWSKWFGVVGGMIAEGQIIEARKNSADTDFWFRQNMT